MKHQAGEPDSSLAAGNDALARGAWREARSRFAKALESDDLVGALEGLSWAFWWLDEPEDCIATRERAFRAYRQRGDVRGSARMALWLGDDHNEFFGAGAVADGWFRRAARLLHGAEACPEHGWLWAFERDMQALLTAELQTRMEPITGLLEAAQNDTTGQQE